MPVVDPQFLMSTPSRRSTGGLAAFHPSFGRGLGHEHLLRDLLVRQLE